MFELVGPRQITDIGGGDVVRGTRLYELIGEFSPFRNNNIFNGFLVKV